MELLTELYNFFFNSHPLAQFAILPFLVAGGLAAAGSVAGSMINANSAQNINQHSQEYDQFKTQWLMNDTSRRQEQAYGWEQDMMTRQENFQKEMSSTAYQRATADMEKAGINPMLAYMQGGASTPTGASGTAPSGGSATGSGPTLNVPQYGNAISQGMTSLLSTAMEVGTWKANQAKVGAETVATQAAALKTAADTETSRHTAKKTEAEAAVADLVKQIRESGVGAEKAVAPIEPYMRLLNQGTSSAKDLMQTIFGYKIPGLDKIMQKKSKPNTSSHGGLTIN